jgi:CheY-like chemotaxis protein
MTVTGFGPTGFETSGEPGDGSPWGMDGVERDGGALRRVSSKLRLLMVDDEEIVREAARVILSELGYEVYCVGDGQEAVDLYREHSGRFDLVIVDLSMPVMGGAECYRVLRQLDPRVRVLLSTGHALEDEARRLLREGAVGFVQKPYTMHQLALRVREVLGVAAR